MSVIGFSFTKIQGTTGTGTKGKIQISNNVGVTDIKGSNISVDASRSTVRVSFRYDSKFEPKVGSITLEGNVLMMLDKKDADAMVEGWKTKKLPATLVAEALNHVLHKCNIQALIMSRDLNLPSPVQMPKVNVETKPKKATKK